MINERCSTKEAEEPSPRRELIMWLNDTKDSCDDGAADICNRDSHGIQSVSTPPFLWGENLSDHAVSGRYDSRGSDFIECAEHEECVSVCENGIDDVESSDSEKAIAKDRFRGI